jgi:TusA-related sulfurtransferase
MCDRAASGRAMTNRRQELDAAARSLIEALRVRDFPSIAACFAVDARLRMLLPGGLEQRDGRDTIAEQFETWFASADPFEITEANVSVLIDRFHISYGARLSRPDDATTLHVIEQHGFGDATSRGIDTLDLVCSGFRPVITTESQVHVFDAGTTGCTDGLAREFRRRILAIPSGDVLRVIVRDPAAKEDLPPLARMLGHTVKAIDALDDGRVQIHVERAP